MSISPQAVLFPRVQPGFHPTPLPRLRGGPHPVPVESPSPSDTIVHVVCSDTARANSLAQFFASRSVGVDVFTTAAEYIADARPDRIACVILDLNLPDIGGLEVQSKLADSAGPPVIFVTARGDLNSGVRAMKNGAVDFMIEPIDYNRLLSAVESAFARERSNRRERSELLSLLRRWDSLTPREQDVFQFTVAGFLNKQAAAELGITENTFQVHRGRVMRKMKAESLADLVRMSTRLESLVDPQRKHGVTAQSLKTALKGHAEHVLRGPNASIQARHFCTNRASAAVPRRVANLRYLENS